MSDYEKQAWQAQAHGSAEFALPPLPEDMHQHSPDHMLNPSDTLSPRSSLHPAGDPELRSRGSVSPSRGHMPGPRDSIGPNEEAMAWLSDESPVNSADSALELQHHSLHLPHHLRLPHLPEHTKGVLHHSLEARRQHAKQALHIGLLAANQHAKEALTAAAEGLHHVTDIILHHIHHHSSAPGVEFGVKPGVNAPASILKLTLHGVDLKESAPCFCVLKVGPHWGRTTALHAHHKANWNWEVTFS